MSSSPPGFQELGECRWSHLSCYVRPLDSAESHFSAVGRSGVFEAPARKQHSARLMLFPLPLFFLLQVVGGRRDGNPAHGLDVQAGKRISGSMVFTKWSRA